MSDRASCPEITKKWPALPWSAAIEYQTPHYYIKTNTSHSAARAIGELMEQALPLYCKLLNSQPNKLPQLGINAYATEKKYAAVAVQLGLPAHATTGLYSPLPPAAIHLYCHGRGTPCRTLLHEGLHQVVDQGARFQVPPAAATLLSPARRQLISIPLWLNEGLAAYMESAISVNGKLEAGRVNSARLKQLKKMIRKKQCPSLTTVLSKTYGDPLTSRDYAVFWGLVYFLKHSPPQQFAGSTAASGPQRLHRYLEACRTGFYADPAGNFPRDFLPQGKPADDFLQRWTNHLGQKSMETFQAVIVPPEMSLVQWEEAFHNYIRQLAP